MGAEWFRTEGAERSPGTIVCTITGQVQHPRVGEVMMGTTLRVAIDEIAGTDVAGALGMGMVAVRCTGVFDDDPQPEPEADHVVARHLDLPAVLGVV